MGMYSSTKPSGFKAPVINKEAQLTDDIALMQESLDSILVSIEKNKKDHMQKISEMRDKINEQNRTIKILSESSSRYDKIKSDVTELQETILRYRL